MDDGRLSLDQPEPPAEAEAAVAAVIKALAAARAFRTPQLGRANPEAIRWDTPLRTATLPLAALREGKVTPKVDPRGWRWMMREHGGPPLGAAEASLLRRPGKDDIHRFGEINEGPYVAAVAEGLSRAAALDIAEGRRFEPVLLVAPDLHLVTLWLRLGRGEPAAVEVDDLVMTLPPVPPPLEPYILLGPEQYRIIQQLAQRVPVGGSTGG